MSPLGRAGHSGTYQIDINLKGEGKDLRGKAHVLQADDFTD